MNLQMFLYFTMPMLKMICRYVDLETATAPPDTHTHTTLPPNIGNK